MSALCEPPTDVPAPSVPPTGKPAPDGSTLGDRRLVARAGLALVLANFRYWTSVAPVVRSELRRWEAEARAIEDPELRGLALSKLGEEGFHAEAAAMLATLAPRAHRRDATEAIVALELLFDYLDGLTERPCADPLLGGESLFRAYTDVFAAEGHARARAPARGKDVHPDREPPSDGGEDSDRDGTRARVSGHDENARRPQDGEQDIDPDGTRARVSGRDEYLHALSDAARTAFGRLPAAGAVAAVARTSAERAAQAQTRMHAVAQLGTAQVEDWAKAETDGTGLAWREFLAGAASSVLAEHALIAAAADPETTPEQAAAIESAYLSTCVLLTLLDGLVDHEQDARNGGTNGMRTAAGSNRIGAAGGSNETGQPGYIGLYDDREELARALVAAATRAGAQARALPDGPHHAMTMVGVVAYYGSAPGARREPAKAICGRLRRQLEPLASPTLWIMRTWRLARRVRGRRQPATDARQPASIVCGEGTPTGGTR